MFIPEIILGVQFSMHYVGTVRVNNSLTKQNQNRRIASTESYSLQKEVLWGADQATFSNAKLLSQSLQNVQKHFC